MLKAQPLKKGDKVAIVSLSSGTLGESFCAHNLEIGTKRLEENGADSDFYATCTKRDGLCSQSSRKKSSRFERGVF